MICDEKRNDTLPSSTAVHVISVLAISVFLSAGCSTAENETATGSTDCNRITSRQIESKADAETDETYVSAHNVSSSKNSYHNCSKVHSTRENSEKITRCRKSFSIRKVPQETDYVNVLTGFKSRTQICTRYTGCAGRIRTEENNHQKWIK